MSSTLTAMVQTGRRTGVKLRLWQHHY